MIVTATLNPAVDKTIEIPEFSIDRVNRVSSLRLDAGGKGINVSKVIASLGGNSIAVGAVGGQTGQMILLTLEAVGIEHRFIKIPGETRTNLKVIDPVTHTNTDINEPGLFISSRQLDELEHTIFDALGSGDLLVLSGSVPNGVSVNIYGRWIAKARELGIKTLLDADHALLAEGVTEGPYLVKPNIHELERLFDRKVTDAQEAARLARSLIDQYGIEVVVVSLGAEGAIFVRREDCWRAPALTVPVRSTVGSGDAVVAALAYGLDSGLPFEDMARLAIAAGSASVMMSGTQAPDQTTILMLEKQVALEPLSL